MGLESEGKRAKEGPLQVLYLPYESSVCITHRCLPSTHLSEQGCYFELLYFEFTPLGRCSHRRPSQLMSRHLTAWEGFYG